MGILATNKLFTDCCNFLLTVGTSFAIVEAWQGKQITGTKMIYYTPELAAQAEEMIAQYMDYHPEAKLPEHMALAAYEDGIWVCDTMGECSMFKFKRLECITSATWG